VQSVSASFSSFLGDHDEDSITHEGDSATEDDLEIVYRVAFTPELRAEVDEELNMPYQAPFMHSETGAWGDLTRLVSEKKIEVKEQSDFPLDATGGGDDHDDSFPEYSKKKVESLKPHLSERFIPLRDISHDSFNLTRKQSDHAFDTLDVVKEKPQQQELSQAFCPQKGSALEKLYQVFDKNDTYAGQIVIVTIMCSIFISGVCLCLETLPENRYPNYGSSEQDVAPVFTIIDLVCIIIFSLEYAIRFYCSGFVIWRDLPGDPPEKGTRIRKAPLTWQKRYTFFWKPLNMIDFLAIIPFYIELLTASSGFGSSFAPLRLLRILRFLRLFKLAKYTKTLRLYGLIVQQVAGPMTVLLIFISFWCIIGASLLYVAEKGEFDPDFVYISSSYPGGEKTGVFTRWNYPKQEFEATPFLSIFHSIYWAVSTFTTVGYGDIYPATNWGYLLGGTYLIIGVIAFSWIISLMSSTYMDVSERMGLEVSTYDKVEVSKCIIHQYDKMVSKLDMLEICIKYLKDRENYRVEHLRQKLQEHVKRVDPSTPRSEKRTSLISLLEDAADWPVPAMTPNNSLAYKEPAHRKAPNRRHRNSLN